MGQAWPPSKRPPGVPRSSEAAHLEEKKNFCKVDDERQNKSLIKLLLAFLPPPLLVSDPSSLFLCKPPCTVLPQPATMNSGRTIPSFFHPSSVFPLSTSTSSFPPETEKKNVECSLHSSAVPLCLSVAPPPTVSLKYFKNCPLFFTSDCQTLPFENQTITSPQSIRTV